jgi:hypothetical protein
LAAAHLTYTACSDADFSLADFLTLEFTSQKNGVKGEAIGLGCMGEYFSPVCAMCCRVQHLLANSASPDTPLVFYFQDNKWFHINPAQIRTALQSAVATFEP